MAVHESSSERAVPQSTARSNTATVRTKPSVGMREATRSTTFETVFAGVRMLTGFVFLWAFLDKTLGWRYSTGAGKGWIDGGSPTKGFLSGVAAGPMQSAFHGMAGQPWADWLFMLGLLAVGVSVMSGVALRFAAVAGAVMMALMWVAEWPPAQHLSSGEPSMSSNPVVDYHVLYAVLLIALAVGDAGRVWGLGRIWERTRLVRSNPWLR